MTEGYTAQTRNRWLRLDDAELLRECRQENYRASGPGGQRRNKVETAVRLHHAPSGLSAFAEESRSREENRKRALRRLRLRIAVETRAPFDAAMPELTEHRKGGALRVNVRNAAYPLVVAAVLDALAAAGASYTKSARTLGITTSQLVKFLRADTDVWRALSEAKQTESR
jgi:hypothetical protein